MFFNAPKLAPLILKAPKLWLRWLRPVCATDQTSPGQESPLIYYRIKGSSRPHFVWSFKTTTAALLRNVDLLNHAVGKHGHDYLG